MSKVIPLVIPAGYGISRDGIVTSFIRKTPVQLKPFKSSKGYLYVNLGKKHRFGVHQLVAGFYLTRYSHHTCVNHINGDRTDNRVENLEWTTDSGNMKHLSDNGKIAGFYGKQKLVPSEELDKEILEEYRRVGSIKKMGGFKGCCRSTLGRYIKRRHLLDKHKVNQHG